MLKSFEMKKKIKMKLKCFCLFFVPIILFGCEGDFLKNKDCSKFANEIYQEVSDTSLVKEAFNFQKYLLEKFGEKSVKVINYEAYHLQFYSSFGYGKSVKFVNKNGVYSIAVKCVTKEELYPDCKEYKIRIDKEEWNELERMIYEFNFWTEEDFKANKDVLDGYAYILEGNRPEAKKCNKKTYKLVGRGSPRYDKIGALCGYILDYEEQLRFRYEQSNKIK